MTETRTLLADYVAHGSEAAFHELVARYIDLVYSTALRLVGGDAHFAEDVTQMVFMHLARKAHSLPSEVMLGGWLHRDTCHVAATLMRAERRRQNREREAVEMNALDGHSDSHLAQLAPILDEAIDKLGKKDRLAILLRFFEQRDLRSVGEALGSSENAAQKRVSRALEELRVLLRRRGVTLSVSALGTVLASKAVAAAPAGLPATVAGAALTSTAAGGGVLALVPKLLAMGKLQVCLTTAMVVTSVTAPLLLQYQGQREVLARDERLRQRSEELARIAAENQRLFSLLTQAGRAPALAEETPRELLRLRGEVGLLRSEARELTRAVASRDASGNGTLAERETLYEERVRQLKQRLDEQPAEAIPELQLLTDRDWLDAAPLYDSGFEHAMSFLRGNAELRFGDRLLRPLRRYVDAHNGQFPSDLTELKPYFDSPIDETMLARYVIVPASNLAAELQGEDAWVITQKQPVNEALDSRFAHGLHGGRYADSRVTNRWETVH